MMKNTFCFCSNLYLKANKRGREKKEFRRKRRRRQRKEK